jgi:3',5'-cyclic AMP phosphodiesterase CpdA
VLLRPRRRCGLLTSAVLSTALATGLLGGCSAASPERSVEGSVTAPTVPRSARAARPVVVVAVGDIACAPGERKSARSCRQGRTARLTRQLAPDAVLALGDLQYATGSLRAFRRAYDRSWGDLRRITYPVPGNHEYRTRGARGYYRYFRSRQPGAPGYYAFDLGRWRVYALNSNCDKIRCGREYRWLRRDLDAHPRDCSIFALHHPRWSSGREHGSEPRMQRFFAMAYRHDVELFLTGHDHDYERFKRMDPRGTPDPDGVMSFVSGAGGKSLYRFGDTEGGSAYRRAEDFGVLRLSLRPQRFGFSFREVDGTVVDRGRRSCH